MARLRTYEGPQQGSSSPGAEKATSPGGASKKSEDLEVRCFLLWEPHVVVTHCSLIRYAVALHEPSPETEKNRDSRAYFSVSGFWPRFSAENGFTI